MCCFLGTFASFAGRTCDFRVVAFYTAKNDQAHISFAREANIWFSRMAEKNNFCFLATDDWDLLAEAFLSEYALVIFLDTRPEKSQQREAFENYMKLGGGWMGFHFAGFALTPSKVPQNWEWYHDNFLGCGSYIGNTWRPTAAVLARENTSHPILKGLPKKFKSAPNEWYRWEKDLRLNPEIQILLSIHPKSFPLGTGPKPEEIWTSGYYPVVWMNSGYRMVYFNMGHNDIDHEGVTTRTLSSSFHSKYQNRLILNTVLWLGRK